MSGTTSVPTISFTDRGFVAPSEEAIVDGLNADYNAAFGGDLNTSPSTPAGQLIASTAAMLGDTYDQETLLFNSVDPAYAFGRMQDAIARIYFLERISSEATLLQVACVGQVGVIIPFGALISDDGGNIFYAVTDGVIPASGTVNLTFASQVSAPIPVPNAVVIYQTITGWNTVSLVSGAIGRLAETRAAFEARRQATVAANAAGFLPAIAGAVAVVDGVTDWYVTENYTGSPVVTGGVTLAANSLYACVAGGTDAAVAHAIWTKKNPGCAYTGNTTVVVQDMNSGYSPPYPSYNVTFERPQVENVVFTVTLVDSPQVPANAKDMVAAAIYGAFTGEDGGPAARIASTLYASRYYSAVAMLGSWAQIVSILIGSTNSPTAIFTAAISGTVMTVSGMTNATFTGTGSGTNLTVSSVTGTIYPGYEVSGTGVPAGTRVFFQASGTPGGAGVYTTTNPTTSVAASLTAVGTMQTGGVVFGAGVAVGQTIVSFGSGTGGTGTYNLSINQTVGSELMVLVVGNKNNVTMDINEQPVFIPGNLNLVLV